MEANTENKTENKFLEQKRTSPEEEKLEKETPQTENKKGKKGKKPKKKNNKLHKFKHT